MHARAAFPIPLHGIISMLIYRVYRLYDTANHSLDACIERERERERKRERERTMANEIVLESAVRGFHVYRAAWTPVLGEELTAEKEPGNSEDPFTVRLKRRGETFGHVPRKISKICWLARDRAISTVVRGSNNSRV